MFEEMTLAGALVVLGLLTLLGIYAYKNDALYIDDIKEFLGGMK